MNSYKLINSDEVRKKLDRLGLRIQTMYQNGDFIIVEDDYFISCKYEEYINSANQEITQKDFLELPEPIKVGDWVKHVGNIRTLIFKVEERYLSDSGFKIVCTDIHFGENGCTKLTLEQVEALELGNI